MAVVTVLMCDQLGQQERIGNVYKKHIARWFTEKAHCSTIQTAERTGEDRHHRCQHESTKFILAYIYQVPGNRCV